MKTKYTAKKSQFHFYFSIFIKQILKQTLNIYEGGRNNSTVMKIINNANDDLKTSLKIIFLTRSIIFSIIMNPKQFV